MIFFLYAGCFLLILYYLFTKKSNYWESKGIPHEKSHFIVGNFYNVVIGKGNIVETVRSIYEKHSTPYVGIYTFHQPALMIRSPELLKKILVKDFNKFPNRKVAANEGVDPLAFHALFTSKDANWRNTRTKILPVFTPRKIKLMFPLMKGSAKDLFTYLDKRNGETLEFKMVAQKYAVDIISSCAFGINSYCLKNDNAEIMKMATRLFDPKSLFRNFSIFSFFFIPKFVDIFRLTLVDKKASDFLSDIFKQTMKEREKSNIVRNDLIDLLIHLKKIETFDNDYKFDDFKMAAQAISFFSAGNDETSFTISFALYELAINREIQNRLRTEIKKVFDENGDISYEALQEVKYLDMVLNETSRKYPLIIFLSRVSTANYTFEETGLTIEKGTSIFIPVAGLHFDPEYFPDPEKFDPERFSDENKHNIKPYTFMPYGEGPRNCIGQRFGILVSKLAIAYIVKDFELEITEKTQVPVKYDPRSFFLQTTHGINLKIVKISLLLLLTFNTPILNLSEGG